MFQENGEKTRSYPFKNFAVTRNTLLNARLVLVYNFYTGLMERLAGVAEWLPGDSH